MLHVPKSASPKSPPPEPLRQAADRLSDRLALRLAALIESGSLAPGDRLPTEQQLASTHGVSRTVVREAVHQLKSRALVASRQGSGVYVEPPAQNQSLAFDPSVLESVQAVVHVVEVRRVLEGEIAALAAERATSADLARIEAALLAMIQNLPGDLDACCKADVAFHREILAASHNIVFRQLAGTIGAALEATFRISTELSRSYERTIEAHRDVLEAIRMRNRGTAEARMRALIDVAQADLAPAMVEPLSATV